MTIRSRGCVTKIKTFVSNHFELLAIGVILAVFFFINYHIQTQVTFLYLYFLPVIMAGYFLGPRLSITIPFLCIAAVTLYCIWSPDPDMALYSK